MLNTKRKKPTDEKAIRLLFFFLFFLFTLVLLLTVPFFPQQFIFQ